MSPVNEYSKKGEREGEKGERNSAKHTADSSRWTGHLVQDDGSTYFAIASTHLVIYMYSNRSQQRMTETQDECCWFVGCIIIVELKTITITQSSVLCSCTSTLHAPLHSHSRQPGSQATDGLTTAARLHAFKLLGVGIACLSDLACLLLHDAWPLRGCDCELDTISMHQIRGIVQNTKYPHVRNDEHGINAETQLWDAGICRLHSVGIHQNDRII